MAKQSGHKMKHHRFQVDPMTPRLRQISTILGMLDDLYRTGRLLDSDIAHKEMPLPLHASLTERRARLQETIGTLEARLAFLRHDKDPSA
jgi:hypothetical protein